MYYVMYQDQFRKLPQISNFNKGSNFYHKNPTKSLAVQSLKVSLVLLKLTDVKFRKLQMSQIFLFLSFNHGRSPHHLAKIRVGNFFSCTFRNWFRDSICCDFIILNKFLHQYNNNTYACIEGRDNLITS